MPTSARLRSPRGAGIRRACTPGVDEPNSRVVGERPARAIRTCVGPRLGARRYPPPRSRLLGPDSGLPAIPVIEFTQRPELGIALRKPPDVNAFIGDTPTAWVDHDLDSEAEQWANDRRAPTLLLKSARAIGLTRNHIRQCIVFSDAVESSDHWLIRRQISQRGRASRSLRPSRRRRFR